MIWGSLGWDRIGISPDSTTHSAIDPAEAGARSHKTGWGTRKKSRTGRRIPGQDDAPNFFYLEGELDLGTPFAQQRVEGAVEISEDGGWFDGTARFGGTSMGVEGEFTKDWIRLEGDISHSWNINAGKIKVTVEAEFDSRDTGVDLDARIQFCEDAVTSSCDSIGGSVSLNGDGDIRVCASVPGVGSRCDIL